MSTVYSVITGNKIETAESYTKRERAIQVADKRHESNPYVEVLVQTKTNPEVYKLEAKPRPVKERKPRKLRPASDAPAIVEGWEVVYTRNNGDIQILRRGGDTELKPEQVWRWNRKSGAAELTQAQPRYAVACVIHEHLILTDSLYAERVVRPGTHCPECVSDSKKAAAKKVAKPPQKTTEKSKESKPQPKPKATKAAKPKKTAKTAKKASATAA